MQYRRIDITAPGDLLRNDNRAETVFFVRMCGMDARTAPVINNYYAAARVHGVILDGQIRNPDENQLNYFNEILGTDFENSPEFIEKQLSSWIPQMPEEKRRNLAEGLHAELDTLKQRGKTDSILKNLYTKVMCWLYYRFARLYTAAPGSGPARLLYLTEGMTGHELVLLKLLNRTGIDILMLETAGDDAYLKQDPHSEFSQKWAAIEDFPNGFCMKQLSKAFDEKINAQQQAAKRVPETATQRPTPVLTVRPTPEPRTGPVVHSDWMQPFSQANRKACTNAWMEKPEINAILTPAVNRGNDTGFFYNAFIRMTGVEDRTLYKNVILHFFARLTGTGRKVTVINDELAVPTPEEIAAIRRRNYRSCEEAVIDMACNLPVLKDTELQNEIRYAYACTMKEAIGREKNLNRLTVICVYLLCWIGRFREQLFGRMKNNEIGCVIYNGGCRNENEAMFMKFLSMLPLDVLILAPDLNRACVLQDTSLLDLRYKESAAVFTLSEQADGISMMTAAACAQSDLDRELYTGTGMFRDRQFSSADSITLQTTYDELFLLWDQELRYRPNFSVNDKGKVQIPVLYAKVSGVEKGNTEAYWQKIRQMITRDTELVTSMPMSISAGQFEQLAVSVLRNGKIRREELMNDRRYPFGMLRPELQQHMLDKVQYMLDNRIIRGTFQNGTEYTVLSTILGLSTQWLRRIQNFDFTRKNPKIVCVCPSEKGAALTDAILLTFASLIGFDVVLFVPTGYVMIEKYLDANRPVEHQAGNYIYDLNVPDIASMPEHRGIKWLNNLFRR